MKADITDRYPGAKTNSGIIHFLINNMPYHTRYFELFCGTAQLYLAKVPAEVSYLNDISSKVFSHHVSRKYSRTVVSNVLAVDFLKSMRFSSKDFIYLDPPYPLSSLRNGKKHYKHIMTEQEHALLLSLCLLLPARIMISTKENPIYDNLLSGWRKDAFSTVDHVGAYQEIIYMNYPEPAILHQYDLLGTDCWDRQRINRKLKRFGNKIEALPPYEKHALIIEMIKKDPAAVQHFLTMATTDKNVCTCR